MEHLSILPATVLGFLTFQLTNTQHGKIGKRLPEIKIKRVQFSPHIKIRLFGRTFWFHHWLNFTILLIVSLFISNQFLDHFITRSFLVGGILEGFSRTDATRIIITTPPPKS